MNEDKYDYIVYIDGSYRSSNKQGGYAAVIFNSEGNIIHTILRGIKYTTNNRMELSALLSVLKYLPEGCKVKLISDSEYVLKPITRKWLDTWIREDFKDKKNVDLWKQVIPLLSKCDITYIWVKGHEDDKYNNYVDQLAQLASTIILE